MGRKSRTKRDVRVLRQRLEDAGLLGVANDGRLDGPTRGANRYQVVRERLGDDHSVAIDEWLGLDFDRPVTLAEMVSLAHCASLALRLASNGREATRPLAIRALQAADRLDQVEQLLAGSGASVSSSSLYEFWFATIYVSQCLLSHFQLHRVPDVLRASDPDAYASIDVSAHVVTGLYARADRAFQAITRLFTDKSPKFAHDEAVRRMYAETLTFRLSAEVQYRAILDDDQRTARTWTDTEIGKAITTLRAAAVLARRQHRIDAAVAMESAALAGEQCSTGPTASLARSWDSLSATENGDAIDTVHRFVMAVQCTPVEEPRDLLDRIERCIGYVSRQGPNAARLRAHAWPHLTQALCTAALTEPKRSSEIASRLASFHGESPKGTRSAHVWVLDGLPPKQMTT
jgi:hypothetical protein